MLRYLTCIHLLVIITREVVTLCYETFVKKMQLNLHIKTVFIIYLV